MTTSASVELADTLDPRLADLIAEEFVWSNDASPRAETLVRLLRCAADAIRWRLEPDGDAVEEQSIERVIDAAAAHLARMRGRCRCRPTDAS